MATDADRLKQLFAQVQKGPQHDNDLVGKLEEVMPPELAAARARLRGAGQPEPCCRGFKTTKS